MGESIQLADFRGECVITGEGKVWVPEGNYSVALDQWRTGRIFNADKLILDFRIVDPGKYFEMRLSRYYNVRIIKPARKYGSFSATRSTDFVREYAALFGTPRRADRIAMSPLESVVIQARVRTVTKARGRRIPKEFQYSVVAELLRVDAGSGKLKPGRG